MTIASFVISCLAVLVAGIALWYARGQKVAAEQSAIQAKRSADAAADIVRIEQERRAEEVAEAERNRVRFKLISVGRMRYLLHNQGTDSAYGVHVDGGEQVVEGGDEPEIDEFPADDHREYFFDAAPGEPRRIEVSWHLNPDCSDARQSVTLRF